MNETKSFSFKTFKMQLRLKSVFTLRFDIYRNDNSHLTFVELA